jgi:regulator of replication initiation timing
VVSVNYGPDFLHENILRGLFDIYHKNHENKEFIDFICKFDIRLSQDKIIRDYILDEDNSDFPKELEGKLIENCLDNKNFDTLNKYFARDNQSNIDIIIKILNSRHKNAFTYVKEHRNLDDNISNIYERSDDIKDKDIKYKVIKYYANYVNQMYLELHGMNKSLRDMVQEIQSKLYLEKQEEVEGFTEEIGGLRKENLELSKKNNALSKENENLKTLCRKSISSLKEVQARLDESEEKSRQVFELGFIMGNTLPLETEVDTPQPDMVAKSQGSHVVQKGPRGK